MIFIAPSVKLLEPRLSQEDIIKRLGVVLSTPYNKDSYDEIKTKHIITACRQKVHGSVFEHDTLSLICTTNIGTYKDFTRHRHCAFTIESTQFVRYKGFVLIPSKEYTEQEVRVLEELEKAYLAETDPRKARGMLPQDMAARMVMTAGIREWWHVLDVRIAHNDNPLTKQLATLIQEVLVEAYPFFFEKNILL